MSADWQSTFWAEIEQAQRARAAGNQGMARVCARRAAGVVIGEYLRRRGFEHLSNSVHERLKILKSLPEIDPTIREIATHFLVHVTHARTLPIQADLIAEARWLAEHLLASEN